MEKETGSKTGAFLDTSERECYHHNRCLPSKTGKSQGDLSISIFDHGLSGRPHLPDPLLPTSRGGNDCCSLRPFLVGILGKRGSARGGLGLSCSQTESLPTATALPA